MLFVTLARICLSEQLEKSLETYPGVILLVSITYSTYPLLYLTGVLLILSHFPPLCSSLTLSSLCFPLSHSHTHSLSLTPSLPSLSLSIPSLPLYHLSQQEELVERALGVDWQRCMKTMATHTTLRTQTTTLRKRWEWSTFRTFLWLFAYHVCLVPGYIHCFSVNPSHDYSWFPTSGRSLVQGIYEYL